MADKSKAQAMADYLDRGLWLDPGDIAAELRRLDAENAALRAEVERLRAAPAPVMTPAQNDNPSKWERNGYF